MRHAARPRPLPSLLLAVLPVVGCYSPTDDVMPMSTAADDDGTEDGGESTGDDDDGVVTSGSSATDASATDASATDASASSTTPTTMTTATDASASDPTDASADDTTGEPADPFCGDGNVDPGEDCDDGEANALTGACRPDCTTARCGDGDVWAGEEGCDDGDGNNVLEIGACAPDCSRVIEEKVITVGSPMTNGDLEPNPVLAMDALCDPGFKAVFAVAGVRQATAGTPYSADDPIDWPLQPFTAYVREDGELVWLTDEQPLLGVRDGGSQPLSVEIRPPSCLFVPCYYWDGVTGLNSNWTNAASNTCNGWTSSSAGHSMRVGNAESTTAYLAGGGTTECDLDPYLIDLFRVPYCVEQ